MTVRLYAIILLLVAVVVIFSGCASSQNSNTLSHNVGVQASVVRMGLDELAKELASEHPNMERVEAITLALRKEAAKNEDKAWILNAMLESLHKANTKRQ